jgi:hypothetical protein
VEGYENLRLVKGFEKMKQNKTGGGGRLLLVVVVVIPLHTYRYYAAGLIFCILLTYYGLK